MIGGQIGIQINEQQVIISGKDPNSEPTTLPLQVKLLSPDVTVLTQLCTEQDHPSDVESTKIIITQPSNDDLKRIQPVVLPKDTKFLNLRSYINLPKDLNLLRNPEQCIQRYIKIDPNIIKLMVNSCFISTHQEDLKIKVVSFLSQFQKEVTVIPLCEIVIGDIHGIVALAEKPYCPGSFIPILFIPDTETRQNQFAA